MTIRKRKKNTRQRGTQTHGGGSMKKRRGGGHRGGRGNAGSGKKADSKKPTMWQKDSRQGGKNPEQKGFFSWRGSDDTTINVGHLSSIAAALVTSGHASHDGGVIVLDLGKMGYTKLLGAGRVAQKLSVTVVSASPGAIAKVKKAGGSVDARSVDKVAVKDARKVKVAAERAAKAPKKSEGPAKKAAAAE
jgi:large subunit ribosomal protein L15